MKKMFILSATLFVAVAAFSQKVQFGLKGGVNISSVNDEARVADARVTTRTGFHAGVLSHIHLSSKFALQPEVVYSKEGADYTHPTYNGKSDLNYINVPVLAQYLAGKGFRLQTGPQLGILTKARFENRNGAETDKQDLAKASLSWAFGLGYLTRSGLGIDARFNLGISDLYKEGVYPGQEARGRVGQIGLFYQFKR